MLCGASLHMSVFTRGGSLHTVLLDLYKDVNLFTKVMNYFTQAKDTWLGYDWGIFREMVSVGIQAWQTLLLLWKCTGPLASFSSQQLCFIHTFKLIIAIS